MKVPHGTQRAPYRCIVTPTFFDRDGVAYDLDLAGKRVTRRRKRGPGYSGDKLRRKAIRGKL